ncbi:DMT family transporter [Pectobacterium peruviense]|uniref:DMT family transporter n=1 Tax=Pectobacterium peruviense TaxID=2066479 RepID=UPI000DE4B7F5|nr:DMT family transporter [Pectobacterium peruviense]
MSAVYFMMAFGAGMAVTLQTTLNGQLSKGIGGDSVAAALFSFAIGMLFLTVVASARGGIVASLGAIPAQPLWCLMGGLLGASALLCNVVLVPRIGLAALLGLVIAGQLISSLVIDHFALLGVNARPVSVIKFSGATLMLLGLAISLFGDRWSRMIFR